MYFLIFGLPLCAIIFLCIKAPRFRKLVMWTILVIVGLVGIITALVFATKTYDVEDTTIPVTKFELRDLKISNLSKISTRPNIYYISADVLNNSDQHAFMFWFTLTLKDCGVVEGKCTIIGEESVRVTASIPPQQLRNLSTQIEFHNLPNITNRDIQTEFELSEVH